MTDPQKDLSSSLRGTWQRFLDVYEPLRPELYRYCRYLTRSPWDAEDLVQDTFARAFVTLGCMAQAPPKPRAWLFRVASNLWIDRNRQARDVPLDGAEEASATPLTRGAREAAGTIISRLSPQERAALVLKEAFDLSLEEIAETLSTTVGAVKAALHHGRRKAAAPEEPAASEARTPSPAVLDAFCAAFNAGDLDRLAGLLLDTSSIEIVGINTEYGPDEAKRGSLWGAFQPLGWDEQNNCGIESRWLEGYRPGAARAEVRAHRGEPIVLYWHEQEGGEVVRDLGRFELEGERIARSRSYFFSPEVIAEICRELGVPFRTNGYTYWRKS
jgi:RNA polymerase sigma-70 factor, ECF subfamily